MTYIPIIEPQSSGTLSNYTVYKSDSIFTNYIATNNLIFTTENYLGSFCVTDVWAHVDSISPSNFSPASLQVYIKFFDGASYQDIAYSTSSSPSKFQVISQPYQNKFYKIPIVATSSVSGNGTTINSSKNVYAELATGGSGYTAYIKVFIAGFYTGAK